MARKMQSDFWIDRGRSEEAENIAALHVEVWRQTYRDVATPEALRQLDEARRLPYWTATLSSHDPNVGALTLQGSSGLGGVLSFGPAEHPAMPVGIEIKHFYLKETARGLGLGRRLLKTALEAFTQGGHPAASLAVVQENRAARALYRAMGGLECGSFTDPGPLWRSSNIVVAWPL